MEEEESGRKENKGGNKKIHEGKAISLCLRKVKIERKKGEKLISHGEHFEE
jgi:hypothetical protein